MNWIEMFFFCFLLLFLFLFNSVGDCRRKIKHRFIDIFFKEIRDNLKHTSVTVKISSETEIAGLRWCLVLLLLCIRFQFILRNVYVCALWMYFCLHDVLLSYLAFTCFETYSCVIHPSICTWHTQLQWMSE